MFKKCQYLLCKKARKRVKQEEHKIPLKCKQKVKCFKMSINKVHMISLKSNVPTVSAIKGVDCSSNISFQKNKSCVFKRE